MLQAVRNRGADSKRYLLSNNQELRPLQWTVMGSLASVIQDPAPSHALVSPGASGYMDSPPF